MQNGKEEILLPFKECESILLERGKEYGIPRESFNRIASLWSAYTGTNISAKDVALMLSLMKVSREKGQHKFDNIVDMINYIVLADNLEKD